MAQSSLVRIPRFAAISFWILLAALSSDTLFACIWVAGTTQDGTRTSVSGLSPARRLRFALKTPLKEQGARMQRELTGSTALSDRNDAAVALIFQGLYPQAIEQLEALEKERPGEYFTAANLGTALELSGRDEEALRWIKEGVRRNEMSHEGTEWLHAKILEAKIRAAKNPDYFKHHSVLELEPSQITKGAVALDVGGQPMELAKIERAISHQLQERLQFVKSKDAPVASLLFDYAAITAVTHSLEAARDLLQMAVEFGYPQDRVQPLLLKYEGIIFQGILREWLIYFGVALLIVGALIYLFKRGWFVYRAS